MKRTLSLILVLTLLFSLMLCIVPTAEETAPVGIEKLQVKKAALEFGSNVHLFLAVDIYDYYVAIGGKNSGIYEGLYYCWEDRANFLKVTINGEELAHTTTRITHEVSAAGVNGYACFKFENIGAKNIGDEFDIKVYYIRDGAEILVDSLSYGAVDYALDAKEQYPDNDALINVLDKMLAYGGAAQTAFNHTGSYDLTSFQGSIKDQSVVALHGNASFANGAKKSFIKEGQTLTATAENNASWLNVAAQKLYADGKTAEIAYTAGKQDIYVIDAEDMGYYFNMDDYTGEEGFAVAGSGMDNAFGPSADSDKLYAADWKADGHVKLYNGYVELYKNATIVTNYTGNPFTPALAKAMASESKTFTLSFTMATDSSNYAIGIVELRTNGSANIVATKNADGSYTYPDTGRYHMFRGGWGNTIYTSYNEDATVGGTVTQYGANICSLVPKAAAGAAPTEFITLHVVFDLVNHTASYYVGDQFVAVHGVPASATMISTSRLAFAANSGGITYVKSIVLTQGDFTKTFN